jgi:hypothetical protein
MLIFTPKFSLHEDFDQLLKPDMQGCLFMPLFLSVQDQDIHQVLLVLLPKEGKTLSIHCVPTATA